MGLRSTALITAIAAMSCAWLLVAVPLSGATSVATQAREKVYVNAGGYAIYGRSLQVRPRSMHILSNENVRQIHWSRWGGKTASGRGTDYGNGPSPGHSGTNLVRITLLARKRCSGRLVYTVVRLHFTHGVPYKGQPHTTKYKFGCP